jgi:hypothetical protein
MTLTDRDVSDELFAALRRYFSDEEIIELTEVIAWENASAKFNRALRIPSQGLWRGRVADSGAGGDEVGTGGGEREANE